MRDLVNATIGFEGLAAEINKPNKTLHRMLAPHGNPSTQNFFGLVMRAPEENESETNGDSKGCTGVFLILTISSFLAPHPSSLIPHSRRRRP